MKVYSILPRSPGLDLHHKIQFSVIPRANQTESSRLEQSYVVISFVAEKCKPYRMFTEKYVLV